MYFNTLVQSTSTKYTSTSTKKSFCTTNLYWALGFFEQKYKKVQGTVLCVRSLASSDTIIKSDNEEDDENEEEEKDDEEELEWNWSQDFVPDATFSFNEIEGHSTITSGNNIQQKSFAKSIVHTYACCWN